MWIGLPVVLVFGSNPRSSIWISYPWLTASCQSCAGSALPSDGKRMKTPELSKALIERHCTVSSKSLNSSFGFDGVTTDDVEPPEARHLPSIQGRIQQRNQAGCGSGIRPLRDCSGGASRKRKGCQRWVC